MIDSFYFSIAGKKRNDTIDGVVEDLINQSYILKKDKVILQHIKEVSVHGHYPDKSYFLDFYQDNGITFRALADIQAYVVKLKDFYAKEQIVENAIAIINKTSTKKDLVEGLLNLVDESDQDDEYDLSKYNITSYSDRGEIPKDSGFMTGIREVDDATNGFQPGTIASICAFVSEGKSTCWASAIYNNVKKGKRGALFSIEMAPEIVWMQLQSRFLYQEHNIEIKASELVNGTLTDDKKRIVDEHDDEFKEFFKGLIILDESVLNKNNIKEPKLLKRLFKSIESSVGCLDFIVFDHVNQFDLMFKDMGNTAIKTIQSACKTYINTEGNRVFCGFAVQTNREGWKRAKKRDGKYDLTAISDLNEVERSSTYVMFLFTSEDMRIVQETKCTLAKNRLGSLLVEPVTTAFNPSVLVVGDLVERVEYNDDFGDLGSMQGDSFDDFDSF